jgi:RNA polymerase sigma factor (sigma-70 family)
METRARQGRNQRGKRRARSERLTIATRPSQPRSGSVFFQSFALAQEFEDLQETMMTHPSLRQISTWPVPPNWAPRDWREEMEAERVAAAWEAERDFDPMRGVPLDSFVNRRVWARARTRYRREWTYALRCGRHLEGNDANGATTDGFSTIDVFELLRSCLRRLPEVDRILIESLFWDGMTEVDVARMLSLSQQAISKRKRRILEQLLHWMGRSEKRRSSENCGSKTFGSLHSYHWRQGIAGGSANSPTTGLFAVRIPAGFSSRPTDRLTEKIDDSWVRRRPRKKHVPD